MTQTADFNDKNLAEKERLLAHRYGVANWKRWGPYLSERQWGTVREDYSHDGSAWDYFPFEHATSRAYRWGEDGIAGISDEQQYLCFSIALWNGVDPILKERIYGLAGPQGNHGEDVKDYYFYLDSTPTHSYMKCLYKYPQQEFPYTELLHENQRRSRQDPEYELLDTKIFDQNRYYDVEVEYAKGSPDDLLIRVSVTNRGPETHTLHLLPTLWFRNTWSWGKNSHIPYLKEREQTSQVSIVQAFHESLGSRWLYCQHVQNQPSTSLVFTNNDTNLEKLFGVENSSAYVKDGIQKYIIDGNTAAVNPEKNGTKLAAIYQLTLAPGETQVVHLRLTDELNLQDPFGSEFAQIWQERITEANEFYDFISQGVSSEEKRSIQRQAFAGMLWSKQLFLYSINDWLKGDPNPPKPPEERKKGRNSEWIHFAAEEILSMPDKWEYPWFAAWDLAFHTLPLAMVDPDFAKHQLDVITREWYMHPNGQLPAYEWKFSDVNPPVHAWATWRVYKIEKKLFGKSDRAFLERVFQKLLLNFTWWVNRKDNTGNNIFEGGFLGLDNIGVFDRSAPLPTGGYIEQADGTSWMGMYCLNLLTISLELAKENPVYEDIATKFFEHFLYIADAMNKVGSEHTQLWDEEDGFYYDVLRLADNHQIRLKVRSLVGLIPLFAVETIEPEILNQLPGFKARLEWFVQNRPDLRQNVSCMEAEGLGARRLMAIAYRGKLRRILEKMLDESEFFGPYGIRGISRYHQDHPYIFNVNGQENRVDYEPAESTTGLFGGNSNWRGPVWMPVNYLLIESLQKFHFYLGDDFQVECPTGSGQLMNLWQVSLEIEKRLISIFLKDPATGHRPVYGGIEKFQTDPNWKDLILFYEYFHGDNGAGLGANHQTGWTGLVAKLIQQTENYASGNYASGT